MMLTTRKVIPSRGSKGDNRALASVGNRYLTPLWPPLTRSQRDFARPPMLESYTSTSTYPGKSKSRWTENSRHQDTRIRTGLHITGSTGVVIPQYPHSLHGTWDPSYETSSCLLLTQICSSQSSSLTPASIPLVFRRGKPSSLSELPARLEHNFARLSPSHCRRPQSPRWRRPSR